MQTEKHKIYPRDPFAVDPLPRAHYHPTREKKLSRDQKLISLSPSRQKTEGKSDKIDLDERLSPMDEVFLRNTNVYQPKMTSQQHHAVDNDEKFDESWPSSERPSSMNLTGLEETTPMDMEQLQATIDRFTDLKKTLSFPEHESPGTSPQLLRRAEQMVPQRDPRKKSEKRTDVPTRSQIPVREKSKPKSEAVEQEGKGGGSVLQTYIERFRNSAPLSREERERQKENTSKDFWWLSSSQPSGPTPALAPSSSSTPKEAESGGKKSRRVTPLTAVNLDKYSNLQKLTQNGYQKTMEVPPSPGDKKTKELQERAEKLLERSSSTVVSTEPAVSTEGLGSNTSGMSSLEDYPYRPKFAHFLDKEDYQKHAANPYTYKSDIQPHRVAQPRPEEDPLHQWRLRRRMDQAQETAPRNVQSFGFLSKTEQQKQIDSQLEEFKRKLAGKDTGTKTPNTAYQFTPAPSQVQSAKEEGPHIASPTLHRRKPRTEPDAEVDPHLHLMCDLLPCPHRGKYDDDLANLQADKTKHDSVKDKRPDKFKQDDFVSKRKRETLKTARDDKVMGDESRTDRESSDKVRYTDENKYKQFLEAEKPDVDSRSDSDRSSASDRRRREKEKRKKDEKESLIVSPAHSDIGDKIFENKELKSKTKIEKRTSYAMTEKPHSDSEEEVADRGQRSKDERSRPKETKKEKLRPRLSSSPVTEKRGVDEAIGQVVKNHLFSMSTSTVISSVESLPPSASVEGLPRVPEHRAEEEGDMEESQREEDAEDESYHSDQEFQDDHLLQMLRKQRAEYERQLREIDATLLKMEQR